VHLIANNHTCLKVHSRVYSLFSLKKEGNYSMKILILGAAGQVARLLREKLLNESSNDLVLYARNAKERIEVSDAARETVIDGDFLDTKQLQEAMTGVDVVYLNDMGDVKAVQNVVEQMDKAGVKRFIGASILGIYNEVSGEFGEWNQQMIGSSPRMQIQKDTAKLVEESDLDYTLLRLTWLYNDDQQAAYAVTRKGEPFVGAQITRQAVAQAIFDIITSDDSTYINESLGLSEPGSEKLSKPSFMG